MQRDGLSLSLPHPNINDGELLSQSGRVPYEKNDFFIVYSEFIDGRRVRPGKCKFPGKKTPTVKELPEKHTFGKKSKRMVWRDENAVHGFLILGEHSSNRVAILKKYAESGSVAAAQDVKIFQTMAQSDLALACLSVFVAKGIDKKIVRGGMLITFSDGSSVVDKGMFLYPALRSSNIPKSSRNGAVALSSKDDPGMKGRTMYLFYPAEFLEKTIATISLALSEEK